MAEPFDKYPTRVEGVGQILPRETPVLFGGNAPEGPLSEVELAGYERNGFIHIESFFDAGEVAAMQQETERLRVSEEIRQSELAMTEPTSGETRSIFGVHTVSDTFSRLACDRRLLGIVNQILDSEVYLHQSRLNLKPGFRGKEFYWHSDFETWHAEDGMPEMRSISCSIALTDNLEFNGPLMLIPGSHKYFCQCSGVTPDTHYQQSLQRQDYGLPSDEQLEWLAEQGGIASPKGPAGSVVLFECNAIHGSNGNISPYPRRNVFFVYNSIDNTLVDPYAAKHERPWYLANREPEVLRPADFLTEADESTLQPA